ncbi:hypothetical protein [Paenibacillus thermotolerans]|uniref:hypothetical protein n=1 Tax=Paenibacillus thermotolerans TaxID=3027807 RepID=UPI002368A7FE|nr:MULTISPECIES: hypothetical protein [unclassified Paenibacillus]
MTSMNGEAIRKKNKLIIAVWSVFALLLIIALILLTEAKEYPFSVPKAIFTVETGKARLVPLTSNASKMVGRRGPTERQLTAFLKERGWEYIETNGGLIIYKKDDITLKVHSYFRKGYWWYDLDKAR